ncbi:ABC transporter permease [Kineococcus sp. SYSU DK001]|uniref:ABC transporter permease n=1 Tax=Kineococcus sp. SYSU DK001 TaxID=3383122 RepID=UPI003D7EC68A
MNALSADRQLQRALRGPRPLVVVVGVLMAVYLLVPMLIVIPASFTSGSFLEIPPRGLSLRWYEAVLGDSQWARALQTSLKASFAASLVATAVATLAVLGISRSPRSAKVLRPVFFLPMVLPLVVLALGLGELTRTVGITGSLLPVVVGQAVLCVPIAFVAVAGGMASIDPALSRAASSMGSSWWRTAWRVELPLLRRSILVAFFLSFAFAFDEVVLALFLAPPGQSTLPAKLYTEATQNVSPLLASVSGCIILFTLLLFLLVALAGRATRSRSRALRGSHGKADPA